MLSDQIKCLRNEKKTNTTKADRIFKKLCTNKLYLGVMSGLALLSVGDIIKEGGNNWAKTLALSIEFTATMGALQRRHVATSLEAKFVQGRKAGIAKSLALNTIKRQINVLCGIGAYAGATFDVFNAIDTGESEDYDAMTFYIISAGAGLATGTISLFFASTLWAGPVGMSAVLIMFISKLAAEYFTDTELEKFINKTILSKKLKIKVNPSTIQVQSQSPYSPTSLASIVTTINGEPYELIEKITLEKWRLKRVKKYKFYKDYHFLLEDLTYTQLLIPFFKLGVHYKTQQSMNIVGHTINNVIGFDTTISASLVQAGLNITEIDVRPYYAIDRVNWLGSSDRYEPLFSTKDNIKKKTKPEINYKFKDPTEEALEQGSFFMNIVALMKNDYLFLTEERHLL